MTNCHYLQAPIRSIATLARVLDTPRSQLRRLVDRADGLYRRVERPKKDGSIRVAWDAYPELKRAHARIKQRVLDHVVFPTYLQGGIRDREHPRDYASNAAMHVRKSTLITEDVADYFPSITADRVEKIWREVFRFAPDVVACLTALTTRNGVLPQGAKTSCHLANLALFDVEPQLVRRVKDAGVDYTRLIDDISVSSTRPLTREEKTELIRALFGMLYKIRARPKRRKHAIFNSNRSMRVNGLVTNVRVSLPKAEQATIRAEAHRYVVNVASGADVSAIRAHVIGRVAKLGRFHPTKGKHLKAAIAAAEARVPARTP